MSESFNVFIATPAYGGMVHTDYVESILPLPANGVEYACGFLGNSSLITEARNELMSIFLTENFSAFTHLLFLDADVGIPAASIRRLLDHKKDIIAAPIAKKGLNPNGKSFYSVENCLEECENGLAKVDHVATGVMLVSRKAAEAAKEWAVKNNHIYYTKSDEMLNRQNFGGLRYNLFQTCVKDERYISEDFFFCDLVRDLGYDVYVDTAIRTRHNGNYVFM